MSFKEAKKKVIESLEQGDFLHEERDNIDKKNKLAVGDVTKEEVIDILRRARGNEHTSSAHHLDKNIDVHTVVRKHESQEWYIKWYLVEPNVVFISVHLSEK
ncbi:hypothetical protein OAY_10190 [Vibrio cyclitrophicus ZF205]|uniref:hypothetical protein n=1 Tax=Vibrio cyclitrophicus TaxID=47951 RepID=UPI000304FDB6|nr:hypothetical protein [Vibrio cyclitrophicus]OEE18288.1 hypothetical protein OAY_10190 [Vibrio cyclitrophicus ZF205]